MKIDSRITIALVFAVFIEIVGGLIWAGQASERLVYVERVALQQSEVLQRLARLEQQSADIQTGIARIERAQDRQGTRR